MKSRWLAISLWFNLLLTAGLIVLLQIPEKKSAMKVRVIEKKVFQAAVKTETDSTNPSPEVRTNLPAPFHWRQIESEDYPVYMANLRKIKCPDRTIRDIITADINELYVGKRQELLAPFQNRFWDWSAEGRGIELFDSGTKLLGAELKDKINELYEERDKLLYNLLGKEPAEKPEVRAMDSGFERQLADFLPEERAKGLHEIAVKFQKQMENATGDSKKQYELRKQFHAEQEAFLTPEELAEFNLRNKKSAFAAKGAVGFEATEEELRHLAQLTPDIDPKSPQAKEQKVAADQQIKEYLGEERFAALQRGQDGNFHQIYDVGSRYNLSEETMTNVYEMRRDVLKQVQQVRKNKSLSTEQREDLLEDIQRETERAFAATLGASALKTYRQHGGDWISSLGELEWPPPKKK